MIAPDLSPANMYFKVNKQALLMLQAHLIGICNYSIIAYLESGGVVLYYYLLWTFIFDCVVRFQSSTVVQLQDKAAVCKYCLQESLYLSMWQSNFLHTR